MCRRLSQRDAYTAETRMEHTVNGKQKENGIRKTGPRHGETRDARNVVIRVFGTTRRKKTTRGRTTFQRERARVLAPNGTDLSANGHEVER